MAMLLLVFIAAAVAQRAVRDVRGRLLVPEDAAPLFALADVHGDYDRALKALAKAKVVTRDGRWAAGSATLVQTGDVVDRGPDTRRIYNWTSTLYDEARGHGGKVVRLLGNHEYMNALLDWRYVDEREGYSSRADRIRDWSARPDFPLDSSSEEVTTLGELFLRDYNVTYLDPVYGAHFMHAGIARSVVDAGMDVDQVGHAFLHAVLTGKAARGDEAGHGWPDAYRQFYASDGPLWYRGYATHPEAQACAEADYVMQHIGRTRSSHERATALVMGHTPNFDGAVVRCDGRVLLIDTGLSAAYGGRPVVLEFRPGKRAAPPYDDPDVSHWREVQVKLHYDDETVHTEL